MKEKLVAIVTAIDKFLNEYLDELDAKKQGLRLTTAYWFGSDKTMSTGCKLAASAMVWNIIMSLEQNQGRVLSKKEHTRADRLYVSLLPEFKELFEKLTSVHRPMKTNNFVDMIFMLEKEVKKALSTLDSQKKTPRGSFDSYNIPRSQFLDLQNVSMSSIESPGVSECSSVDISRHNSLLKFSANDACVEDGALTIFDPSNVISVPRKVSFNDNVENIRIPKSGKGLPTPSNRKAATVAAVSKDVATVSKVDKVLFTARRKCFFIC